MPPNPLVFCIIVELRILPKPSVQTSDQGAGDYFLSMRDADGSTKIFFSG